MTQPTPNQPYTQAPGGEDPGKTMGIVGIVLAFVIAPVGIIVSAIAGSKSKKAGFKNTPAKVGLILGIVFTVFGLIGGIASAVLISAGVNQFQQVCAQLGPGEHTVNGVTYTCPG